MESYNPLLYRESVFELTYGDVVGELRFKRVKDKDFAFFISLVNQPMERKTSITGIATQQEGDLESREDENENAYFVKVFNYRADDGHITIAIDLDSESLAWVNYEHMKFMPKELEFPDFVPFREIKG